MCMCASPFSLLCNTDSYGSENHIFAGTMNYLPPGAQELIINPVALVRLQLVNEQGLARVKQTQPPWLVNEA